MFLFSKPCHVLNFLALKALCSYIVCSYIKKRIFAQVRYLVKEERESEKE